jgi:uncharacterized membrane protein
MSYFVLLGLIQGYFLYPLFCLMKKIVDLLSSLWETTFDRDEILFTHWINYILIFVIFVIFYYFMPDLVFYLVREKLKLKPYINPYWLAWFLSFICGMIIYNALPPLEAAIRSGNRNQALPRERKNRSE